MIKYLWHLSPAGAIQKEIYYQLDQNFKITEIQKNFVPKYSPFQIYKNQNKNYSIFEKNAKYPIQNGYVLDLRILNQRNITVIAFSNKGKLCLKLDNHLIEIDNKTEISCLRILNYCFVKLIADKFYSFKFIFPFHYLFLHDAMQSTEECSPFFYLMKQWENKETRKLWIESWDNGMFTDRWIN